MSNEVDLFLSYASSYQEHHLISIVVASTIINLLEGASSLFAFVFGQDLHLWNRKDFTSSTHTIYFLWQ